MSKLRITHETTYAYRRVVRFGPHRLVLRPREGHDVRVVRMHVEIEPQCELQWSRDLFGNSVATAHFLKSADRLRISSEVLLEQSLPFPGRAARPAVPVRFPVTFSGLEATMAAAYQATTFPDDVGRVKEWVDHKVRMEAGGGAEDAVAQVTRAIRQSIKYRRREAKGVQTPSETLNMGSGSCRDMATLMLEALRVIGLPARFASGYLDCAASEAGRASTHAWAEAYLPEIGWVGYDPTLGEATSAKHVVTGVSNHPRGVMPVGGTFLDDQKTDDQSAFLSMEVGVRIERLAPGEEFTI